MLSVITNFALSIYEVVTSFGGIDLEPILVWYDFVTDRTPLLDYDLFLIVWLLIALGNVHE